MLSMMLWKLSMKLKGMRDSAWRMHGGEAMSGEHSIQADILEYLEKAQIMHWRNNSGTLRKGRHWITYGCVGSPDIICVIAGRFVGVEVKDAKKKQEPEQVKFQARLEAAGGRYLLVRSVDELRAGLEIK